MDPAAAESTIQWHDSVLLRVTESPSEGVVTFEVEYAECLTGELPSIRRVRFTDVTRYRIDETPFEGCPTVLSMNVASRNSDGRSVLRIETSAGTREITCREVLLEDPPHAGQLQAVAT
jgi:hypothetical protein